MVTLAKLLVYINYGYVIVAAITSVTMIMYGLFLAVINAVETHFGQFGKKLESGDFNFYFSARTGDLSFYRDNNLELFVFLGAVQVTIYLSIFFGLCLELFWDSLVRKVTEIYNWMVTGYVIQKYFRPILVFAVVHCIVHLASDGNDSSFYVSTGSSCVLGLLVRVCVKKKDRTKLSKTLFWKELGVIFVDFMAGNFVNPYHLYFGAFTVVVTAINQFAPWPQQELLPVAVVEQREVTWEMTWSLRA